ncbi:RTPR, ribonucleoside-triphosphate reductase, adenosylcobalamin-dependent [uncultured Caudovirales phage]|uniref:ribonucleoside-triphosphate reductase (thioredoxin) n=1 Tax=uncultured Caudovirales phage TaxID=2100421 RepID=A0A6J5R6G0_9CAUD|nr:RTPR, ribonucleoside-triphosphate reductase, adenosylcobalamin-dependent [uncultured Caudovirales phage]CAB4174758.1 RTPR, ribonucleoside-triphosphate reductase, adenosylcobalamin-dependent [uncultured Caudovirales phage]CAB4179348.1 RTPR, ribonucleoside-triphosphate reductase, adenosylcobalamin-dependent [uncultured Caudovirales phage]CAB4189121.1 RTPR, ribonucleoside-triphosphate reductase, adenosylcobalamin-dependent [uncultured Caudovirales phage]CAB4193356.1 RTPR, ribonucleoside-triphos
MHDRFRPITIGFSIRGYLNIYRNGGKKLGLFSFELANEFVASYNDKKPPFGYKDAAGNSVGEITFLRTYSRLKPDGTKETWVDVCERVINGMYSLQKDHAKSQRLPWSDAKAAASAKEAFDRLFNLKWTPPGRGLWVMGTPLVNEQRNSAALQNCAFVSTGSMVKTDPAKPFAFLMEASMLGVGVGFDDKGADKDFNIYAPQGDYAYDIPDTREGWVESTAALINAYLKPDSKAPVFNYEEIRKEGEPIKTFGGTAAGPEPLMKLHDYIHGMFKDRSGQKLTRRDIADIGNVIGVCVVSGNVRRSAELLMGRLDDQDFLNLKNYDKNPERMSHGWMSNNSVEVSVGQDLSKIIDGIARNGEPGVIWMDVSRKYGRLVDPENNKDWRIAGYNPCAEQSLESYECCTLVETYLNRHDNLDDFKRTLKFAYLYAKTVTLIPTHWQETNAIMQRNRRIGTSISGIANFADNNGWSALRTWMDDGYKVIQNYDNTYSEWLGVRQSIKMTTVKPSGTVSILAGESPGVHWASGGKYFLRAIRFANSDPMLPLFQMAQYRVEPAAESPQTTSVVFFPVKTDAKRAEKDVSIYEKVALASVAQRYWSDNSVSVTVTFDAEKEADSIESVLHMYDGQLKTISFLPMGNHVYAQMPYTQITAEEYEQATMTLFPIDLSGVYAGMASDAIGEAYCTTDACEVKLIKDNQ